MNEQSDLDIEVVAETRFLRLLKRGTWSFVSRIADVRVVAVVAVTDDNCLLLVEQHRLPLNQNVIELPAGLAGDVEDSNESLKTAAIRELGEETGYEASTWAELSTIASSAGLTDEKVTVFRARGLKKTGPGGGCDGEEIVLHEVPLANIATWLKQKERDGCCVDGRVFAALYWVAEQRNPR